MSVRRGETELVGNEERRPGDRSRWLAVLRKELLFPVLAAVIAGVIVLGFEYGPLRSLFGASGPVQSWNTHGASEVEGVQSWGQVGVRTDGHLSLSGTVADMKDDGRGVELRIETTSPQGVSERAPVQNTKGVGKTVPMGNSPMPGGNYGYELGNDVTRVRVANCLMPSAGKGPGSVRCGPFKQIYEE